MKRKPNITQKAAGFTLVELLVVIVIIAGLAAIALTIAPRMKKRGESVKNIQIMRQVSALSAMYSAENSNRLVPMRTDVQDGSGNWAIGMDWPIALLIHAYPQATVTQLKDRKWWLASQPFMYNPMIINNLTTNKFAPGKNGFGMNSMLGYKLNPPGTWGNPGDNGSQSRGVNISQIDRPSKTVLFSTTPDYHFNNNTFTQPTCLPLIVDGKVPMMFVDGHTETIAIRNYLPENYDYTKW